VRLAGTNTEDRADVVVLGGGPGGYTAAFRAADLGLRTVLVERHPRLGGVCLNVGCIPSKALLHAARILVEADEARELGISFGQPRIDLDALRAAQERTVATLAGGLDGLARKREVRVVRGTARLVSPFEVEVEADGANGSSGTTRIPFASCIIAVGSEPVRLPGLPADPRIMDSTGALALPEIPERLLVVGGGTIGLEMAAVYDALGSRVTVVEMRDGLMPGCDPDLVRPLHRRISARYEGVHVGARLAGVEAAEDGLHVSYEGAGAPAEQVVDRMLIAVGRRANGDRVGAEAAGVAVGERGLIAVDDRMRTNVGHIYAIGDVVGEPMLAHKAARQGAVAAEVIAGRASAFDVRSIPSVAYTDPEVAWTGLTETEARATGVEHEVHTVPWAASGRALTLGRSEGRTKLIVEPGSRRILGAGIVGVNAGELIAEVAHALEMGADAEDLALTIHPHPTLSETFRLAAEAADGSVTDLYVQPRQSRSGPE
jgi:dihydrolipoyl dehydrogenase